MHFVDSNHEVTQKQQEKKQQHLRGEIHFMLMTIPNITSARFNNLMIVLQHV